MRRDITAFAYKKPKFLMIGELKEPTEYYFNGLCLENVYRVLGSDKHGYVYFFVNPQGKRQKTVNPMWDDSANKPKNPKTYSAGERVCVYASRDMGRVRGYDGNGWYRVKFDDGREISCNINSFQRMK